MFGHTARVMSPAMLILILLGFAIPVRAQTAFTYNGRLVIAGVAVTGTYDFQFKLYTAASGGSQVGGTLSRPGVGVSSGNYSVSLDFGVDTFANAPLFVQASQRKSGGTV